MVRMTLFGRVSRSAVRDGAPAADGPSITGVAGVGWRSGGLRGWWRARGRGGGCEGVEEVVEGSKQAFRVEWRGLISQAPRHSPTTDRRPGNEARQYIFTATLDHVYQMLATRSLPSAAIRNTFSATPADADAAAAPPILGRRTTSAMRSRPGTAVWAALSLFPSGQGPIRWNLRTVVVFHGH